MLWHMAVRWKLGPLAIRFGVSGLRFPGFVWFSVGPCGLIPKKVFVSFVRIAFHTFVFAV